MQFPLATNSNDDRGVKADSQRLLNLYAKSETTSGMTKFSIYPTPGNKLLTTLTDGTSINGSLTVKGVAYFVYSTSTQTFLVSVTTAGAMTTLGTFTQYIGTTRVTIVNTSTQLLITTGDKTYLFTISGAVFTDITADLPFDGPVICSAIDQYFIAVVPDSDQFYMSDAADGTTWDALTFATTSTANFSDNIVGVGVLNAQVWFFGEYKTTLWSDIGSEPPGVPVAPQLNLTLNYGAISPWSQCICKDMMIWPSQTSYGRFIVVACVAGSYPTTISTDALSYQLSTYSSVSDAFAFSYTLNDHEFYILTFPSAKKTWCYDTTTQLWTELQSYDRGSFIPNQFTRWVPNCYTFLNGFHMVGDYLSGKIFTLDSLTYTDDSYYVTRQVTTPCLYNDNRYSTVYSLELMAETGQGLSTGQGSNPQIWLETSRDGGFVYGNQRFLDFGDLGDYKHRIKWNLLGRARHFVWRLTLTDPIPFILYGIEIRTDFEDDWNANYQGFMKAFMQSLNSNVGK